MTAGTTRSEATNSLFIVVKDPTTGNVRRVAVPADLQIGLDGRPAELHLTGRFSIASNTYAIDAVNKGTIYASSDETIIGVSLGSFRPITGRIKLYLPSAPRDGQLHFIKDLTGTSADVPIDIFPGTGRSIDGQASKTLDDAYGSLALMWLDGTWHMMVAGLGSAGGAGASTASSFITINPEGSLTGNRQLSGSSNVTVNDHGAKQGVSIDLTQVLGLGAGTFSNADITVDAYGRITAASSGLGAAPTSASYITAVAEPSLPNYRVLSGGSGITVLDGGNGGTKFQLNVDPRVVPYLTGATFSGNVVFQQGVIFNSGLTGSLTQLSPGVAYIVGVGGITATTNSLGQVILSTSLGNASVSTATWTDAGNTIYTTSSVSIDTQGRQAATLGSDVYVWVSGTVGSSPSPRRVVFGGDVVFSGSIFGASISGSLTRTTAGNAYLVGQGGISLSTNSLGQVIVSGAISQSWGQVNGGLYTTGNVAIDAQGRTATQLGSDVYFWVSGTLGRGPNVAGRKAAVFGGDVYVSGSLIVSGPYGISGSLQRLHDGNAYLVAGTGIQVTTNSLGQVIVAQSTTGSFGPWNDVGNSTFTTSSVSIDPLGRNVSLLGSDVFFYVSGTHGSTGSAAHKSVFGGDVYASGSITSTQLTGSLSQLASGLAYLVPGRGMTVSTSSTGQVAVAMTGDPTDSNSPVILTSATGSAPAGRTLTAGVGITLTDNGPGGTLVVASAPTGGASVDPAGPFVLTSLTGSAPAGRVLTGGTGVSITDYGAGQPVVVSANLSQGFVAANYAWVTSSSEYNVSVAGFANVPNVQATIASTGSPLMLVVNANVLATSTGSQTSLTITRNGTNLGDATWGMQTVGPTIALGNQNGSLVWVDTPGPGTWTYRLQASQQVGTARLGAGGTSPTALGVFEMKNANVVTATTTGSWSVASTAYSGVPGLSASIFVTRGPVLAMASITGFTPVNGNWIASTVYRSTTNLESLGTGDLMISVGEDTNQYLAIPMVVLDQTPTVGSTNTYSVQARNGAGSNKVGSSNIPQQLILWELTDTNWKYVGSSTQTNLGSSYTDIIGGVPATLATRGRPVFATSLVNNNTTNGAGRAAYTLQRNGTSVTTASKGLQLVDGENNLEVNRSATWFWFDVVSMGSYVYKSVGYNVSGSNFVAQGGQSNLFVYELDSGQYTVVGPWTDTGAAGIYTTSSVSIDPTGRTTSGYGSNIGFFVSGSASRDGSSTSGWSVFAGDVRVSGTLIAAGGLTGSLQRLSTGEPYIVGIGSVAITTASNGQIVVSGSGGSGTGGGASTYSTYLTVLASPELPNSRALIASGNIVSIDTGPTGSLTLLVSGAWYDRGNVYTTTGSVSIDSQNRAPGDVGSDVFFFVSGTVNRVPNAPGRKVAVIGGDAFVSGAIIAAGGLTGSLQRLTSGDAAIAGTGGVTVTTSSQGQVIVSSSMPSPFWGNVANSAYTTSSVSIDSQGRTVGSIGSDVFFFVSGTVNQPQGQSPRKVAVFGGDAFVSGALVSNMGFTGSLTRLANGSPYIVGAGVVTILTGANGQVIVSGSASSLVMSGAGGIVVSTSDGINYTISGTVGAPPNATYVVQAPNAGLPNALVIQGVGGVATSVAGSNLQVSSSLVTVTGSGGTSVATGGGTTYVVSSSVPVVQNIVGTGSVGISRDGQTWYVSSSIYANASASYVVVGIDAENPNERRLAATGGLTLIDGGAKGTLTISGTIGAPVSSSYVVMALDGVGPNERNLIAGAGITITDNGPGNSVIVSAKAAEVFQSISGAGGTHVSSDGSGNYVISSSIYASPSSSYIVVSLDARNPNERTLQGIGGTSVIDNGAGSTFQVSSSVVTLSAAGALAVSAGGGTSFTVSGAAYAQRESSYLVAVADAQNTQERVLTTGPNIVFSDGGPGASFQVSVASGAFGTGPNAWVDGGSQLKTTSSVAVGGGNSAYASQYGTDVFLYVSGTLRATGSTAKKAVFAGDVVGSGTVTSFGGFTGSLTQLANGNPYLVNAGGIQVTTNSLGQVLLSASVSSSWGVLNNQLYTTGSVSIDAQGRGVATIGSDVYFWVSGTSGITGAAAKRTVLGGDVLVSGSTIARGGLTGSLTRVFSGDPYIITAGQIAVFTTSLGQVLLSGTVSSSWGKVNGGLYTTGTVSIDSGGRTAGQVGSDINLFVSGTVMQPPGSTSRQLPVFGGDVYVSGAVYAGAGGFTGSLTRLLNGNPYLVNAGGIQITTNSLGQVLLSASVSSSWGELNNQLYTTGSVSIDGSAKSVQQIGSDVYFWVSGTRGTSGAGSSRFVVGGDAVFSASVTVPNGYGLTGSLTQLAQGAGAFMVALGGTATTTSSTGQVVFSSSIYAHKQANYLVTNPDAQNPQERTIAAGPYITFVDSGPGGTFTVEVTSGSFGTGPNAWVDGGTQLKTSASVAIGGTAYAGQRGSDAFLWVSGTVGVTGSTARKSVFGGDVYVSGSVVAFNGLSGSLTMLADGVNAAIVGLGTISVTTNSLGQVIVQNSVSGTSGVAVRNQDVALPLSTYSTLNFSGSGVTASDVGGGTAFIKIVSPITMGAYSTRPAPGNIGYTFYGTDTLVTHWIDDGTRYRPLIQGQVMGYEPPLTGSFATGVNNGSSVLTQYSGSFQITGVNDGGSNVFRGYVNSHSSTTAYIEACIAHHPGGSSAASTYTVLGVAMRESSSGKIYVTCLTLSHSDHTCFVENQVWVSSTSRTVSNVFSLLPVNAPIFIRIRRDSTNIYAEWSRDRLIWQTVNTTALSSAFTTAPDQSGIMSMGANIVPRGHFLSLVSGSL